MVELQTPKVTKTMTTTYGKTIPQVIRNWREKRGYSQTDLAKILKVKVQYVSNVERAWYMVPHAFCKRVAKHMDYKTRHALETLLEVAIVKKINRS